MDTVNGYGPDEKYEMYEEFLDYSETEQSDKENTSNAGQQVAKTKPEQINRIIAFVKGMDISACKQTLNYKSLGSNYCRTQCRSNGKVCVC